MEYTYFLPISLFQSIFFISLLSIHTNTILIYSVKNWIITDDKTNNHMKKTDDMGFHFWISIIDSFFWKKNCFTFVFVFVISLKTFTEPVSFTWPNEKSIKQKAIAFLSNRKKKISLFSNYQYSYRFFDKNAKKKSFVNGFFISNFLKLFFFLSVRIALT